MVDAHDFLEALSSQGVLFFTGVPDSLLRGFCDALASDVPPERPAVACQEGAALAMAMGHQLATGNVPLVYLQNSGLGNLAGAAASLAHRDIYGIPMLLLVGWRGELRDGVQLPDEPQHVKQGRCTLAQLDLLDIPCFLLEASEPDVSDMVRRAVHLALRSSAPVAIVVRKDALADRRPLPRPTNSNPDRPLAREDVIRACVDQLGPEVPIVCTTGMASRELYEARERRGLGHRQDFLTIGGMGMASSLAWGIARADPSRRVVCIDGDGALLMQMGAMTRCAGARNLVHLLVNNGAHDSVGGQPTLARDLNLADVATSLRYTFTYRVQSAQALRRLLRIMPINRGSIFIEVLCRLGARPDLGRPRQHPREMKEQFMSFLQDRVARAPDAPAPGIILEAARA